MARKMLKPSTALYPVPVVLLTCADAGGRPNMITLAWVGTVCSEPPMISVSILGDYWSLKEKVGSYGFSKGKSR